MTYIIMASVLLIVFAIALFLKAYTSFRAMQTTIAINQLTSAIADYHYAQLLKDRKTK